MSNRIIKSIEKIQGILDNAVKGGPGSGPHGHTQKADANTSRLVAKTRSVFGDSGDHQFFKDLTNASLHSRDAVEHSENGKHAEAAESHNKAAEAHRKVASSLEGGAGGNNFSRMMSLADEHKAAYKMHKEAAKEHSSY